jgi:hypothetical protein
VVCCWRAKCQCIQKLVSASLAAQRGGAAAGPLAAAAAAGIRAGVVVGL